MEKKKRIGLLISEPDIVDQKNFIDGFLKQMHAYGYDVCIFAMYRMYQETTSREVGEAEIFDLIPYDSMDAIVVFADSIQTPGVVERLESELKEYFTGPVLFLNRPSTLFQTIYMDDYALTKQLISHLIEKHNYRDIAYLTGKSWDRHAEVRLQGYRDCMAEHGLSIREDRIFYGDFWYSSGDSMVYDLMKTPEDLPEAVACANDCMAIGAAAAFEKEGIRVPEDVALVGFECSDNAMTSPKPLTSVYVPYVSFGAYTADAIVAMMQGKEIPEYQIEAEMFVGNSCGCDHEISLQQSRIRPQWDTETSKGGFYAVSNSMMEDMMCQTRLQDLYNVIFSYAYQIRPFDSFHLCLNRYWANETELVDAENDWSQYTNEMLLAVKCGKNGSNKDEVGTDHLFKVEELIPDMNEASEEPVSYIFTPIFFEEKCLGYAVVSYDLDMEGYDGVYRSWLANVMRGLECFRRLELSKQVSDKLQSGTYKDELTQLDNYKGFMKNTESLVDMGNKLCVIALDIKGLSKINETYGRDEGNQAIVRLSSVIRNCKRVTYSCCLGKDEYLLATVAEDLKEVSRILDEFNSQLAVANETSDKYKLEVHVGNAMGLIKTAQDIEHLINEAVSQKNGNKVAEQRMLDVVTFTEEEQQVANVVQEILDQNLFSYHFQPIISAKTGEIFSYEALMRSNASMWVSPLDILKYAEALKRLTDVERYTFFNVIDYISEYNELFEGKKVFINSIPGVKLTEKELTHINDELYSRDGQIVVELTEQAELNDRELTKLKDQYNELGVEMAVDDYGTGYSNVTNLLRYMPRYVKIDRMLLSEIQNSPQKQHFVNEIIEFAHNNNIMALAEGVETFEELQMVIHLGADLIQGYYVAKPSAEVVQNIPIKVKREIHQINMQEQFNRNNKVYVAGKEYRISLAKLSSEEYECISVPSDEVTYRDVCIQGVPGLHAGVNIQVADGYHGRITLETISLSGKKETPCIEIGEDCDVTLILNGENELRTAGIRVPENSKLTFAGEGSISITANYDGFFGVGNDVDKKHGELHFEQSGTVEVYGNGVDGVGIGAGLGGKIFFDNGKYNVTINGKNGVGVGSISGDTSISIKACDVLVNGSVFKGVGIGSINGRVTLETAHISIRERLRGTEVIGIGSWAATGNQLQIAMCDVTLSLRALKVCGVGSFDGAARISIEYAGLNLEEEAEYLIAVGDSKNRSYMNILNGEINLEADNVNEYMLGVADENIVCENGKINLMVNGEKR